MNVQQSNLLTTEEVAQILQCGTRTFDKLRSAGEIAWIPVGRLVRFDPADVAAFRERRKRRAAGESASN